MLDHVTISVSDLQRSLDFYERALRPLGIDCLFEVKDEFAGFGIEPKAFFWIGHRDSPQTSVHVAFTATDRATVDRFYNEALAAGGRDNGSPGIRSHYHPDYYGAFVFDPDGHNIEAVCHSADPGDPGIAP